MTMNIDPDNQKPVQCVDNQNGFPGVIVYDNQTFPFPNPQCLGTVEGPACENEPGHNSLKVEEEDVEVYKVQPSGKLMIFTNVLKEN